jgi:NAD(P)-dependent dehydrogenase (short-subunit alcohol dehydrogenase family)
MRLKGKIAIVTGGGGGIGRATATRFAKEGAKVTVSDIDPLGGEETVSLIQQLGEMPFLLKRMYRTPIK